MEKSISLDDIEISEATLKEADEAGKIENFQLSETHEASVPTLEYSIESARKFFMSPANTFFLGQVKGSAKIVAGGGLAMWLCPYFYKRCFVLAVYTDKELRRIRLSTYLQIRCIQKIFDENANYIEAMIHQTNTASLASATKSSELTGYQNSKENRLKVAFYGSYPDLPATWEDFVKAFNQNYKHYGTFVEQQENKNNPSKEEEKKLKIVWNFEPGFEDIYKQSTKLDWSKTSNIIETDESSKLSNKKLEIFYRRLESIKGTSDYDSQIFGFVLENNRIQGLVYLSNYIHICLGARFLTLSEISLFEKNKIDRFLPFIFKQVHL